MKQTVKKKKAGRNPGSTGKELKKSFTIRAYPSKVAKLKEQGQTLQQAVDIGVALGLDR